MHLTNIGLRSSKYFTGPKIMTILRVFAVQKETFVISTSLQFALIKGFHGSSLTTPSPTFSGFQAMSCKPHPPLMKKHSQTDLVSRLKTRKILGVGGEDDDGEVHRSKVSSSVFPLSPPSLSSSLLFSRLPFLSPPSLLPYLSSLTLLLPSLPLPPSPPPSLPYFPPSFSLLMYPD